VVAKINTIPEYFDAVEGNFKHIFDKYFLEKNKLNLLQIGAYSGRCSIWILSNINKTCTLTDIDTWAGSTSKDGHLDNHTQDFSEVERLYDSRVSNFTNVKKYQGTSDEYFKSIIDEKEIFDFVYIDGSHKHDDVYNDAINAYKHLKTGGIIAFDDYFWEINKERHLIPHFAIKKFISEHDLEILIDENSIFSKWEQLWVLKK
jgi:hypothetical protein